MSRIVHTVTVNNKKYEYSISPSEDQNCYYFVCRGAGVAQDFLKEDIPALLVDLPELIISEIEYKNKQNNVIRFRVNVDEKKVIAKRAVKAGYSSVSSFLRALALGK